MKAAAFVLSAIALARTWSLPHGLPDRAAHWVMALALAVAAAGLVLAIGDRLIERESISMAFVLVNVSAHGAMVAVALAAPPQGGWVAAFCALMLAGDAVKVGFLATTDFEVRGLGRRPLIGLTSVYLALYLVALVAALAA